MQYSISPIVLFTYNRIETLAMTIGALKKCTLAEKSDLFIFSDGCKEESDISKIAEVRSYIKTITGFKSLTIILSDVNRGLADSIIKGVTQIINQYGKVIVLEDDLITSVNFLCYMNVALEFYKNHSNVFSISGYSFALKMPPTYISDVYFTKRGSSWGWATWQDKWSRVDWEVKNFDQFTKNKSLQKAFNQMGSDLSGMLKKQMKGELDSWAIRWVYSQFHLQGYTVSPTISKVANIGFGEFATHTRQRFNKFQTTLDQSGKTDFLLEPQIELDPYVIKQFISKYSVSTRVYYKILNLLSQRRTSCTNEIGAGK